LDCLDFSSSTGQYALDVSEPAFSLDINQNDTVLAVHEFSTSNTVPFSTPGPAFSLMSYDPLAEDVLTDPESPQPADELDREALNFRWEPFNRKGPPSESSSISPFRYHPD
jgi:hypothetical protein